LHHITRTFLADVTVLWIRNCF